jgi:hypothetical protein
LQYLEAADALIRKSLTWIKQQCTGGKGVSNEKLDAASDGQLRSGLVCRRIDRRAFRGIEYAGKVAAAQTGDGVCLEERMALVFCAEALQNIHNRCGRDRRVSV